MSSWMGLMSLKKRVSHCALSQNWQYQFYPLLKKRVQLTSRPPCLFDRGTSGEIFVHSKSKCLCTKQSVPDTKMFRQAQHDKVNRNKSLKESRNTGIFIFKFFHIVTNSCLFGLKPKSKMTFKQKKGTYCTLVGILLMYIV